MTLQRKTPPSSQAAIDQQLGRLREGAAAFGRASPKERVRLLSAVKRRFHELGPRFVELDCLAKGIPGESPRSGECGFEGPAITLRYLAELERSIGGERTLDPAGVRVHSHDVASGFRERGRQRQPDISEADDPYLHARGL